MMSIFSIINLLFTILNLAVIIILILLATKVFPKIRSISDAVSSYNSLVSKVGNSPGKCALLDDVDNTKQKIAKAKTELSSIKNYPFVSSFINSLQKSIDDAEKNLGSIPLCP